MLRIFLPTLFESHYAKLSYTCNIAIMSSNYGPFYLLKTSLVLSVHVRLLYFLYVNKTIKL
jgi:hypothetical protein